MDFFAYLAGSCGDGASSQKAKAVNVRFQTYHPQRMLKVRRCITLYQSSNQNSQHVIFTGRVFYSFLASAQGQSTVLAGHAVHCLHESFGAFHWMRRHPAALRHEFISARGPGTLQFLMLSIASRVLFSDLISRLLQKAKSECQGMP